MPQRLQVLFFNVIYLVGLLAFFLDNIFNHNQYNTSIHIFTSDFYIFPHQIALASACFLIFGKEGNGCPHKRHTRGPL